MRYRNFAAKRYIGPAVATVADDLVRQRAGRRTSANSERQRPVAGRARERRSGADGFVSTYPPNGPNTPTGMALVATDRRRWCTGLRRTKATMARDGVSAARQRRHGRRRQARRSGVPGGSKAQSLPAVSYARTVAADGHQYGLRIAGPAADSWSITTGLDLAAGDMVVVFGEKRRLDPTH